MSRFYAGNVKDFPKSSSITTRKSVPAPLIEFSVTSEEGIHLFVDMNSSLIDWNKRFESEVGTCLCYQTNKYRSFREELQYLGYKFELRKSSLVSDTNSSSKLNFEDENFDSHRHPVVINDDSSFLLYPDAKNEYSGILVQEQCYFQGVAEHLEQMGENSVSSCVNSVANELLVDLNSNVRHEVMHQAATGAKSSLNLQKRSEKLKSGGERKRRKHTIQSDTICGQYCGRILRSAKRCRRQSYPRKCKLEKFK